MRKITKLTRAKRNLIVEEVSKSYSNYKKYQNLDTFSKFRDYHSNSCPSCKDRHLCYGGCPITPSINLCDREERSY